MTPSEKLWPIHLKPKEDELLSSWLVRLARAYCYEPFRFCNLVWPDKAIWNRDIDKSADDEIVNVLAEKTATPHERVFATTLRAYEGWVYEKHNPLGNTPWITPVGMYRWTHRKYGLQFCPYCLREDSEPYFRRKWRLAFVVLCEKHGNILLDRCQKCGEPVNFHRNHYDAVSITLCYKCGVDLREAASECITASEKQCKVQATLLNAANDGYVKIPGTGYVYSHLFFQVLHHLMKILSFHKKAKHFRRYIAERIHLTRACFHDANDRTTIEWFDTRERCELLMMACWLIDKWPYKFIRFCKEHALGKTDLTKDMNTLPFWYIQIVELFDHESRYVSSEEIGSVIGYLKRKGDHVNLAEIRKVLGVCLEYRKRRDIKTLLKNYLNIGVDHERN